MHAELQRLMQAQWQEAPMQTIALA
jgi:hypothetical protein